MLYQCTCIICIYNLPCVCLTEQHIDDAVAAVIVKDFTVKLLRQLPLDDSFFFAMLRGADLLPLNSGPYIKALNTNADKVEYFLHQIITPAASQNLPKLLRVMENSDAPNLVRLANEIQEKLAEKITVGPGKKKHFMNVRNLPQIRIIIHALTCKLLTYVATAMYSNNQCTMNVCKVFVNICMVH